MLPEEPSLFEQLGKELEEQLRHQIVFTEDEKTEGCSRLSRMSIMDIRDSF